MDSGLLYSPDICYYVNRVYKVADRTGIADSGEFYIRPPEPLPGFLIKLNIKN